VSRVGRHGTDRFDPCHNARMSSAPTTDDEPLTLRRWDRVAMPFIVIAAILPIVGVAAGKNDTTAAFIIGILCWLVFLVDFVVRSRLSPGYVRTRAGKVDLAIVIVTCPWYLFVPSSFGAIITVARFARLVRVAWVALRSKKARQLMERLGTAGLYAGGLLITCSLVVKWVEPPSSGYATYGDAFWWGFVTITTVGYGDLTPVTTVGRIAAICLMFGGVALLGVLAGTLASFFGLGANASAEADVSGEH
jgi:voltage-gated potassium channel